MNIDERDWESVDWINLAQNRWKWQVLVNMIMDCYCVILGFCHGINSKNCLTLENVADSLSWKTCHY